MSSDRERLFFVTSALRWCLFLPEFLEVSISGSLALARIGNQLEKKADRVGRLSSCPSFVPCAPSAPLCLCCINISLALWPVWVMGHMALHGPPQILRPLKEGAMRYLPLWTHHMPRHSAEAPYMDRWVERKQMGKLPRQKEFSGALSRCKSKGGSRRAKHQQMERRQKGIPTRLMWWVLRMLSAPLSYALFCFSGILQLIL